MKIIFDHTNGVFTEQGNSLLEVFAIKENETEKYMFENGWLPFQDRWYQTCSSRLELKPISKRRKKELSKIKISYDQNFSKILNNSIKYEKFDLNYLNEYLKLNHYKFFFDDCFCGIVNIINNIPYYTFMLWDERNRNYSYGTLSFYYLIDKFYNEGHKYLYTSEYYPLFSYKKKLQGFEWWDGQKWQIEDKS
jgi:hypothetical protein